MTKVFKYLFILTVVVTNLGCDKQVSEYIDAVKRNPIISENVIIVEPLNFHITPGKLSSATTGGAGYITGTVGTTNKLLVLGSDMSMTVTMSRGRLVQN